MDSPCAEMQAIGYHIVGLLPSISTNGRTILYQPPMASYEAVLSILSGIRVA